MGGGNGTGFVPTLLRMPKGELCQWVYLLREDDDLRLIGRLKKQNADSGLKIYHLDDVPELDGHNIVSFKEKSASGAFGEFINRGTSNEYKSQTWAKYDPVLRGAGL